MSPFRGWRAVPFYQAPGMDSGWFIDNPARRDAGEDTGKSPGSE
jgi:hypothetical protein